MPRICLPFAGAQGPQALPVVLAAHDGRYFAGIQANAGRLIGPGQEVVLLVDERVHDYDRRAIHIRGQAQPAEAPAGAPIGHACLKWFRSRPWPGTTAPLEIASPG